MTKTEIAERIAQGEDSRTQFKHGPIGIAKLASELVAFVTNPYRGLGSGIKRVTEITKHVEFISDSEANFFTAKLYKQPDAPSSGPVNTECGPVNAESGLVSLQAAQLLEIIRAHPGVNKNEVARISGIAIRTVKRRLEQTLRGKVEFRGAPKNGGYYVVVESSTKRTKAKKRKQ